MYEEFEKIVAGVEADLQIDRLNINEKAMKLPAIKHYWIAKFIRSKIELKKRQSEKATVFKTLKESDTFNEIGLTQDTIKRKLANHPKMMELDNRIAELEMIIDYLSEAKFVLAAATQDIKNSVELIKLEEQ